MQFAMATTREFFGVVHANQRVCLSDLTYLGIDDRSQTRPRHGRQVEKGLLWKAACLSAIHAGQDERNSLQQSVQDTGSLSSANQPPRRKFGAGSRSRTPAWNLVVGFAEARPI